jgi:UDP-2-acetamido-3-amino-2,3-dideoxy-glucuronate N-acetyltransferase
VNDLRETAGGYFVHESSYVDEGAEVGRGTRIWHFCHVNGGAVIGEGCSLGQNVVVMAGARLGRNVKVQNNVSIYEGVVCEDDVFLGPSMVFTNVVNPRSHVPRKTEYQTTLVRRGASIGANATILCGNTLGEYCFVGAGAVVTSEVPAYALVIGVPARLVGWMCRCGERLPLPASPLPRTVAVCEVCQTSYEVRDGRLAPGAVPSADARHAPARNA